MQQSFKTIPAEQITDNPFRLIGSDWMLITAGEPQEHNTMTASWGGFGVLWNKNICFCVIRPVRHTYSFVERAENFTLSFFEEAYRDALTLCGTTSGRDINKASAAKLTPVAGTLPQTTYFAEARLVIECRKIYFQDLDPEHFLDPTIQENYPEKDYHRMYIGEIANCLGRRDAAGPGQCIP